MGLRSIYLFILSDETSLRYEPNYCREKYSEILHSISNSPEKNRSLSRDQLCQSGQLRPAQ